MLLFMVMIIRILTTLTVEPLHAICAKNLNFLYAKFHQTVIKYFKNSKKRSSYIVDSLSVTLYGLSMFQVFSYASDQTPCTL